MVNGQLEFLPGSGKNYELLRLRFAPNDEANVAGPGTYWLSSESYAPRAVCCVNSDSERNGFDILKEAYAGADSLRGIQDM